MIIDKKDRVNRRNVREELDDNLARMFMRNFKLKNEWLSYIVFKKLSVQGIY